MDPVRCLVATLSTALLTISNGPSKTKCDVEFLNNESEACDWDNLHLVEKYSKVCEELMDT